MSQTHERRPPPAKAEGAATTERTQRSTPVLVEQDGSQITITIRAPSAAPVDELVPVSAEALAPIGLEYRPVLALAQAGTLRTCWIGRRRYTRRSWLLALLDVLPPATAQQPGDELAEAVGRRAARRVAR